MSGPSRRRPGTKQERQDVRKVTGYPEAQVKRIDHARLRKADLVIASGVVERVTLYLAGERWVGERSEAV